MDLWDFDLSPQEYMAAHFLERTGGRVSGAEVAERLGVSEKTARRVLSSLAGKGLIYRIKRARYALLWVTVKPAPGPVEPVKTTASNLLSSTTSSSHVLVDVPSGTSTRAAPLEGDFIEKRLAVADDLEPGRLKPSKPKKPRRRLFNMPDKYHRFSQPREEWGVPHVVKEFHIRYQHAFPKSIYVVEGKNLSVTLNQIAVDYGITVSQMMTALDQFFTHHTHRVPDDASPTRYFLQFVKDYIQQQPDYRDVGNASPEGEGSQ